ncbi:MAG: FtsQ-type POTRA domain-containing protein [Deltaproteobacteria bacterium]|nr:FtsQ-type POTRA domain-containing protein [Deltaproteobacteria bacterium]
MDIRTTPAAPLEAAAESRPAAPEKNRYLRRTPGARLRRSQMLGRRVAAVVKVVGRGLFFLAGVVTLAVLLVHAFTSDRFRVDAVIVAGTRHTSAERLQAEVRRAVPDNILEVDLAAVRALVESDTWVRRADVRRVLPSTLVVTIEERLPATLLEIQREIHLADAEGVILGHYDAKYGKLDVPVFKGLLGDSPASYRRYQGENSARVRLGCGMLQELESGSPAFPRAISEVDLSEPGNVRVLLVSDPVEISLGDRDFLKRFRAFMANADEYQKLRGTYADIASVDLRFDGQIIYRPRGEPAVEAGDTQPGANPTGAGASPAAGAAPADAGSASGSKPPRTHM